MRLASWIAMTALVCVAAPTVRAGDGGATPATTALHRRAIVRGLDWLAGQVHQDRDARWPDRRPATTPMNADVAVAALEGLAFLASGSDPARGDYRREINACLDHVLDCAQESGLISSGPADGSMYGHGYATLFLAEVYARTKDPALQKKLNKAVALIAAAQNREGGWRYSPRPVDADVSVTACQLNALLASRAAGIDVDDAVIDKAVNYVIQCRNNDGGYTYMAGQAGKASSATPRTAAALAVLLHHGASPADAHLAASLEYLCDAAFPSKPLPPGSPRAGQPGHVWYLNYYAGQALCAAGGDWLKSFRRLGDTIVAQQADDGSWQGDLSPQYATASALITLQAPDGQLWIFKPAN